MQLREALAQARERISALEEAVAEPSFSAQELLDALLENTEDLVYFKDRDRRFIAVSRSCEALFGREQGQILGKRDEDLFPPEIAAVAAVDDERVLRTGEPLNGKIAGGAVNGAEQSWVLTSKLPWFGRDGEIRGLCGISKNISNIERMQAAVAQSERQLRIIGDALPFPVGLARARDGVVLYANRALADFVGVPAEALCGCRAPDLFVDAQDRDTLLAELRTKGRVEQFMSRVCRGDGVQRWSLATVRSLVSEHETLLLGVLADITEHKQREQQLERLSREKDVLLQEVNHRVGNNLATLLALVERERSAEPAADSLGKLSRSIRALARVHGMLSDVRWSPVRLSTLCVQLLDACCGGISPRPRYRVTDSELTVTSRVAQQLAIVLGELVSNTIKHSADAHPRSIHIEISAEGPLASLRYADDGRGYPPHALTGGAKGLGLSLIHRLTAHSLRGALTLSNDRGAIATLLFDANSE